MAYGNVDMIDFVKMHGAGNDYVYVDATIGSLANLVNSINLPALAKSISDRHFGVGGDGLVVICPSEVADFRMRMFNADGSEAQMCGNASRCVAKLMGEEHFPDKDVLTLETLAGIKILHLHRNDDGSVGSVTVDMGAPVLQPEAIPVDSSALISNHSGGTLSCRNSSKASRNAASSSTANIPSESLSTEDLPTPNLLRMFYSNGAADSCRKESSAKGLNCGEESCKDREWDVEEFEAVAVGMGNPHCAIFLDEEITDHHVHSIGRAFEKHPAWPEKTNVEFLRVISPDEMQMRVWERGSGETLACGTGACAATVAGILTGRLNHRVKVNLPGGSLEITWDLSGGLPGRVLMRGSATKVAKGIYYLSSASELSPTPLEVSGIINPGFKTKTDGASGSPSAEDAHLTAPPPR